MLKKYPRIKKEDKVIVVTGKEKGKIGKVLKVDFKSERLFVEKVNLVKRHSKPSSKAPHGGIVEKEAPLNISNVMIVCNKCGEPSRIGKRFLDDGTNVRVCKKCNDFMAE